MYSRRSTSFTVITPRQESEWWKNFTEPTACRVWYRGVERPATGEIVTGTDRRVLQRDYFETHALVSRLWGISSETEAYQGPFDELVVVRFRIE